MINFSSLSASCDIFPVASFGSSPDDKYSSSGRRALQTQACFLSSATLEKMLTSFESYLKIQQPNTLMIPSSLGSTGFTFLCEMPNHEIKGINQDKDPMPIKFVLKWLNDDLAKNEKFCADFYRCNALSAPVISLIPKKIANRLGTYGEKKKHSMSNYGEMTLIGMPRFHASTLNGIIHNGKFLRLTTEDHAKIFSALGEVAIYDLLIGNDDRVIRLDFNSENFLSTSPRMNLGNIMFYIEGDENPKLKEIYYIDNATSQSLAKAISTLEDFSEVACEEDYCDFNLFCENSTEIAEPCCTTSTMELKEKNIESLDKRKDELLEKWHRVCAFLLSNPDLLASHIETSVLNAISEDFPEIAQMDIVKNFKANMLFFIREGIEIGMTRSKSFCLPREIFENVNSSFCEISFRLIEKNLKFLNNNLRP